MYLIIKYAFVIESVLFDLSHQINLTMVMIPASTTWLNKKKVTRLEANVLA